MMKKIIAIVLTLALALTLASCGSAGMTMGTGGTAGTYYAYGNVLGSTIKEHTGINVTAVSTDGSKANIQGIDAGIYQLATVQSDVLAYAWAGSGTFEEEGKVDSFRVVAGLYAEAVQLITMDKNIKSVADLKGKTVSIGAPGSGVYFNAIDVLTAAGLTENDINAQKQSFADSADALKNGQIDAAFIVAGAPTPAITDLCTTNNAWLVPIARDIATKIMNACPYYTSYTIPAGTYKDQEADVETITVKATLICDANASEDDIYALTAAIFDNKDTISHAKSAELDLTNATTGMDAPFHKGAAKYFAEKGITVTAE